KNGVLLYVSGRNDWSCTLPRDNWSYFYPSVGLGVVISDLLHSFPSFFTFAKLRASYAEVGNDAAPFQLSRTASILSGGLNGYLNISNTLPNELLMPERTSSVELGADLRFIKNRIGIDISYYKANSVNQLFSI